MKRIPKKMTFTALLMAFLLLACPRRFSDSGEAVEAVSRMNLDEAGAAQETISAPLPQTVVYDIVADFLAEPLPDGKSAKKVLLMGYDGFRRDGLVNICNAQNGAVCRVSEQGGLYDTYAGGAAGIDIQATSTAPGWVSILTGQWSGYTGITDNGQTKRAEVRTVLTDAAEVGYPAAFVVSWPVHTEVTYREDILLAEENHLPIRYTLTPGDEETADTVISYVTKREGQQKSPQEDPAVLFFTLEYTDHAGHTTGFGNQNADYAEACRAADETGGRILDAVQNRSTFEQEEWLILITTDHGGTGVDHGGQSREERATWLSCNRKLSPVFCRKGQK